MNQVELLRHVADNLEAGRPAGHGLLCGANKSGSITAGDIGFNLSHLYSLAPRTRIINGVEVPAPMDNEPAVGGSYWFEAPSATTCSFNARWAGGHVDKMQFERGLCYDSEEAAAANCRARYGIK